MAVINKPLKEYKDQLSNNLKCLLETHSLNILELASKLELSYTPIYNLTLGSSNPTLDTLLKIANYFNISISQLIGELPINKIDNANYLRTMPILQWGEVLSFIAPQNSASRNYKQLLVASEHFISEKTFALYANEKTEPLFKIGTTLIFDKVTSDIKNYDNKYVLLSSDTFSLAIKKLFVEESTIFTQSINTNIPPQALLDNVKVLAYLIQARMEFHNI